MKKYFHVRKPMQAKAKLQVLDEPVRPVDATGLTAQTTRDTNSAMKGDSSLKPKIKTGGFL